MAHTHDKHEHDHDHNHNHDHHDHAHDHDHDHKHEHGHHGHHHHNHAENAPSQFNKAFALAVSLNLIFTIIEAFYAYFANSMSLMADAGHNLGDVLGLGLAWGANLLLARGSSDRYSYGFKKTTILAALINAGILVAASALIAYESVLKLIHPSAVHETTIIVVALIGILINGGTALLFNKGRDDDLNVKAAFLHLAFDALISFGVVVSGIVILFTHFYWLDPLVGLLIVITIVAGTWGVLRESVDSVLDAVPKKINSEKVAEYFKTISGVTDVHDLHIWSLSTKEIALTVHLTMPEKTLADEDYARINQELAKRFAIKHVTIQVEQGLANDPCVQSTTC